MSGKNPTTLDYAPRSFKSLCDREPGDSYSEAVAESRELLSAMSEQAEQLNPRDAVLLAQRLLVHVEAFGIDYGDFQSAQAVQKYVRRAIAALRGLSLS